MNPSSTVDIYSGGPSILAYMIAVMQAAYDGKPIQYRKKNSENSGRWKVQDWSVGNNIWNWPSYDYRVDPASKLTT